MFLKTQKVKNLILLYLKINEKTILPIFIFNYKNKNIKILKSKTLSKQQLLDNINNWLSLIEKDEIAISIVDKILSLSKPFKEFAEVSQGLIPYDKYRGHTPEQIKNKYGTQIIKKMKRIKENYVEKM